MKKRTIIIFVTILFAACLNAQQFDWVKQISGSANELILSCAVDSYDNTYSTGTFEGIVDFDPTNGVLTDTAFYLDMFVEKFDPAGNLIWVKIIHSTYFVRSKSIAVDNNNDVLITGSFKGTVDFDPDTGLASESSINDENSFVLKLNSNGDFVWIANFGGIADDKGASVITDSDNNIYSTGEFTDSADFDPGPGTNLLVGQPGINLYISKLSGNGNLIWAKNAYGASEGLGIAIDKHDNPFATGVFTGTVDFDPNAGVSNFTSSGDKDCFVLKLDTSGTFVWAKSWGGVGEDNSTAIKTDSSGNVYTTGNFSYTADFDPATTVFNMITAGTFDAYVLKLDSAGSFIFAKQISGPDDQVADAIDLDITGNIYFTGYFAAATDFDPGPGTLVYTSYLSSARIFICKLDSSGNLTWAYPLGTLGEGCTVRIDHANNIYTAGYYLDSGDFNPLGGVYNLANSGGADVFLHKMSQGPAGITENNNALSFQLYPNPAAEEIYILAEEQWKTYQIVNMTGDLVQEGSRSISISIQDLPSGIYIFRLINEEGEISQKKFVRF